MLLTLKNMSYRKVVFVRGILFTLVLLLAYHYGLTELWKVILYGSLLPLRLLFYFNMPITKYKLYPTLSFLGKYFITTEDEKLLLDEMSYNAKKGSHLYEQKDGGTYFFLTIFPSIFAFLVATDLYLTLLFKAIKYLLKIEHLFSTLFMILGVVLLFYFIFSQLSLLNKAKIQDDLKN